MQSPCVGFPDVLPGGQCGGGQQMEGRLAGDSHTHTTYTFHVHINLTPTHGYTHNQRRRKDVFIYVGGGQVIKHLRGLE